MVEVSVASQVVVSNRLVPLPYLTQAAGRVQAAQHHQCEKSAESDEEHQTRVKKTRPESRGLTGADRFKHYSLPSHSFRGSEGLLHRGNCRSRLSSWQSDHDGTFCSRPLWPAFRQPQLRRLQPPPITARPGSRRRVRRGGSPITSGSSRTPATSTSSATARDCLLIDFGSGKVLDHLRELGISKVDWILHTHHHRDQCQGDGMAAAATSPLPFPRTSATSSPTPRISGATAACSTSITSATTSTPSPRTSRSRGSSPTTRPSAGRASTSSCSRLPATRSGRSACSPRSTAARSPSPAT